MNYKKTNQAISFWGIAFILSCGLIIGFGSGYLIFSTHQDGATEKVSQEREYGKYAFINPLLECNVAQGTLDSRKINFRDDLVSFITDLKDRKNVVNISVMFRDLNNGPTFGLDEDRNYTPASLLKLPVVMAALYQSEDDPSLLSKKVLFKNEYVIKMEGFQLIPPKDTLKVGSEYTVMELIERSMVYSDNQALALLAQEVGDSYLNEVLSLFGRTEQDNLKSLNQISIKEYSSFFRILFNGSFLSRKNSNLLLEILSKSDFGDGLRAGVPENISVSHKFGEAGSKTGAHQLHDCGIVYYPNHPYLLCVMTEGERTVELEQAIESISQFVFEEVSRQR